MKKLFFYITHKVGSPYIINYENTTDRVSYCVLFGFQDNIRDDNYGNPAGVIVTNKGFKESEDVSSLLYQTENKPLKFASLRVQSDNSKNMTQPIFITHTDADGTYYEKPIMPFFQKDSNTGFSIYSNTHLSFKIQPTSEMILCAYPYVKKAWVVTAERLYQRIKNFLKK